MAKWKTIPRLPRLHFLPWCWRQQKSPALGGLSRSMGWTFSVECLRIFVFLLIKIHFSLEIQAFMISIVYCCVSCGKLLSDIPAVNFWNPIPGDVSTMTRFRECLKIELSATGMFFVPCPGLVTCFWLHVTHHSYKTSSYVPNNTFCGYYHFKAFLSEISPRKSRI